MKYHACFFLWLKPLYFCIAKKMDLIPGDFSVTEARN